MAKEIQGNKLQITHSTSSGQAIETYKLPTLEELLEAGVHFGHQTKRWHPKIAPYLYKAQNKIHIFDLLKTHQKLIEACDFLYQMAKEAKAICFVGTKKQASEIVKKAASDAGAFFVTERWTGGMLTNFDHVRNKMLRLKKITEGLAFGGQYENYTKKERLDFEREGKKLEEEVGGVVGMERVPEALFVVDIKRELTAVTEARKLGLKVVALVDSNCDPTLVDYPIPGNDDASAAIEVIVKAAASAVAAGYKEAGVNFQKLTNESRTQKERSPEISPREVEAKKEIITSEMENEEPKAAVVPKEKVKEKKMAKKETSVRVAKKAVREKVVKKVKSVKLKTKGKNKIGRPEKSK